MDHTKTYIECYGRNSLTEYKKAHDDILSRYDEEELKKLDTIKLTELCKGNKRGVVRVAYLRVLKIIGINCTEIEKEYTKYQNFCDKYTTTFGSSNLLKCYTNYYLPIISKFGENSFKNEEVLPSQFIEWYKSSRNVCKKSNVIYNVLKTLDATNKFLDSIKGVIYDDDDIHAHLLAYRKNKDNHHIEARMFAYYYKQLNDLSRNDIPNITFDSALKFCDVSTKHTTGYVKSKIDVLRFFGCKCIDDIILSEKNKIRVCEAYRRCNFSDKLTHIKFHHFREVDICLEKIENALTYDMTTIVNKISGLHNSCLAYTILKRYYEVHDFSKVALLENASTYMMKQIRRADQFKLTSEWRKKLLNDIADCYRYKITQTSAYPQEYLGDIEYKCCVILEHIEKYARVAHKIPQENDAIRWFLFNCSGDNVKNALIDYGRSLDVDHTRVKNTHEDHHAKRSIVFALGMFKTDAMKSLLQSKTYTEIEALGTSSILNHIENLRIIGESKRRVYLDEEIEKMLKAVENDSLYTLIITILREIGLRAGAVCNMRYGNIIDQYGTPRHVCRVLEKGNKIREFVTGPNLKRKIVSYIATLEKFQPIEQNTYLFNIARNKPLPATTLANKLKRVALDAGVTDIVVHPHVFRHTIVGKLMDVGNSAEVVSKFMGHANVDTTLKWYWLKNIEEITRSINNPFVNGKANPTEYREEIEEELENSRVKIETCLRIIHATYEMIDEAVKTKDTVIKLKNTLHTRMPTLQNTLQKIANSVGETETVMTSQYNDIESSQDDDILV
jgi:integrase